MALWLVPFTPERANLHAEFGRVPVFCVVELQCIQCGYCTCIV